MPTPVTESNEGGQHVEWSETFHAFVFRARIYLKRLWWIIIFTVATGVIVQKWKTRDAQPTYVSTGEMWVSNLVSVTTGASISEMVANFFQNQIHLMQSADLQNRTMANVLAQHIEYAPPHSTPWVVPHPDMLTGTSILQLTVTSNDPKFAQYFLETWMQDFLQFREENRQQAYARTNTAFESVASKYQAKMQDLETELSAYIKSHDFASVESAQKAADEVISKLGAVKDHIAEMDSQLQFLQPGNVLPSSASGAASPPSATAPGNTSLAAAGKFKDYIYGDDIHGQDVAGTGVDEIDQGLASLKLLPASPEYELGKDQLRSLQAKYTQLGLGLGPKHPHMADLQNSIDQMLSKLQELRLQRVIQLDKVRDFLQREYAKAVETEKSLVQQNKDDNDVVIKIGDLTTQIDIVKNINYSAQQNSASLGESRELGQELLQINLHATDAQEQIVNPLRPVIEGGFVGLAAGIVIIFLLGALDGRVMSIEDLTQRFDEPMLGVIPMQKRINGQVELLKHGDQRQMFAEACRNIRSSLLYMDRQGQRPRIIMLTSSMPSEGKSTLSSNLAITLGFAASRTLLVDADMRRGQLHKRFGLPNDMGLAEHIADGVPLEKIIQSTGSENLDFISCGKYPAQPGELLMSDRFRDTIQTLRQRYDFVVFDSPPILLTDDAASFATRADAVIFVVRAGFTRLRQVRTSLENLHRRSVNVYGMVVNFIDHREPGYYTYRYYDYYSHQPEPSDRKKSRSA